MLHLEEPPHPPVPRGDAAAGVAAAGEAEDPVPGAPQVRQPLRLTRPHRTRRKSRPSRSPGRPKGRRVRERMRPNPDKGPGPSRRASASRPSRRPMPRPERATARPSRPPRISPSGHRVSPVNEASSPGGVPRSRRPTTALMVLAMVLTVRLADLPRKLRPAAQQEPTPVPPMVPAMAKRPRLDLAGDVAEVVVVAGVPDRMVRVRTETTAPGMPAGGTRAQIPRRSRDRRPRSPLRAHANPRRRRKSPRPSRTLRYRPAEPRVRRAPAPAAPVLVAGVAKHSHSFARSRTRSWSSQRTVTAIR